MSNKDICPTAFLVDDASKLTGVVVPRCLRLACETLDSTKGRVLCDTAKTHNSYVRNVQCRTWMATVSAVSR